MSLRKKVRGFWISCQRELFFLMDEVLGPVTGRHKKLLMVLEMVSVECLLPRVPDHMPGRPRKGEERPKEPSRLERQRVMRLEEMLDELPKQCAVGVKRNAKGYKDWWIGYKLHMDVADGGIPISCIVSSASLHDSQAAIPLATMTAARVRNLYDLMDSAYDAEEIRAHSESLDHVPIIDDNPRRKGTAERSREVRAQRAAGFVPPQRARYKERSTLYPHY